MRGISKERLIDIFACYSLEFAERIILQECHELQEPWMTLEDFLKSDFQGLCWMLTIYNDVVTVKFFDDKFILVNTGVCVPFKFITQVMPIHKPEPPK